MFYTFPTITHIKDIIDSVDENFAILKKEYYDVVTYHYQSNASFPPFSKDADNLDTIRKREFRGLIFDKQGNLIRRAYHKFFNLDEREETLINNVDFNRHHFVLEKLDGSMITPLWIDGHMRLATKAGITSISMEAETFIAPKKNYIEFLNECHKQNLMPIFEWCSLNNRIVVEYPEPQLILTAIRHLYTGEYMDYPTLYVNSLRNDIPLVKKIYTNIYNIDNFINEIKLSSGNEGIVIRFDNGHMIKLKSDWYVAIHRAKDNLLHENRVIELIMNNKVDDVLPYLIDKDKQKLMEYAANFIFNMQSSIELIKNHYLVRAKQEGDRKHFALNIAPELPKPYTTIIFSCWDGKDVEQETKNMIKKSLTSQGKIDNIRQLWGNVVWNSIVLD